ncbi:acetate/propionate family kinase [Candidatus Parabeggiatoa sp. HSG14]|uniref:acetate/propionate family kinase n=1 Tax=Candidatus Parabeggiatoa sp. HSG14 TaxID=3055593 RepID=UPI0025A729D7|nr:acetate/propionate family kinase [Thiotrichales bacterium HSG14]
MNNAILVVNAGSSSIKCSLYIYNDKSILTLVYHANITGIGTHPVFIVQDANSNVLTKKDFVEIDHEGAFSALLEWIDNHAKNLNVVAAGHRMVHGGMKFTAPIKINKKVLEQLEELIPLAPLHQPHNLAPIHVLNQLKPDLLQVACFDTAFHATQPAVARTFAIPRSLTEQGIKGYGFHGLSYEYIVQCLPDFMEELPARVIVAHLGNGASMAAIKDGQCIATTMHFTALDGLPMGTRCGTIDPGVLLHLLNNGMDLKTLNDLLYHRSGLLGVSGISSDMQTLLESDLLQAKEAIDLFVYRIGREIGSLTAALGGLDALVFTGGIGEHAAPIRAKVCKQATWLDIQIDTIANEQHQPTINTKESRVSVLVIPTNEEKMIAQHTYTLLNSE